jgi:NagD protein
MPAAEPCIGVVFDLDGTLYLSDKPIPGAAEAVAWVRERGAKIRFLSNNPRRKREAYAEKLSAMGIAASGEEVITSTEATVRFLRSINAEKQHILVVGEEVLCDALRAAGMMLTTEKDADIVLVSFDTTLVYGKLLQAHRALRLGARFFATNPDVYCPTRDGGLPDAGSLIALLEASTGRRLELAIGKPSRFLACVVLEELGTPPERCVMVGDRAETDICFGHTAGMATVLVRTGATGDADLPEGICPDWRVDSVGDLPSVLTPWMKRL